MRDKQPKKLVNFGCSQSKGGKKVMQREWIRTPRVWTCRSALCSVVVTCLCITDSCSLHFVIAPSDCALPLMLPLTQEDCIPCKTFIYLEGKLREQALRKGTKYLSYTLKVEAKIKKKCCFPGASVLVPSFGSGVGSEVNCLVIAAYLSLVHLAKQC